MLQNDLEFNWENPSVEQIEAFEMLQTHLPNLTIFGIPIKGLPYMVFTKSSQYALG